MQKKTGIWEGSIWEYLQPPILYSWYSCWYCIFFLDKGFLGITKAITILSSQKNYPRHSLILEEKPRRNKYIFGANIKIINLYTTLQLFHKKISYRAFWCMMSLLQNILFWNFFCSNSRYFVFTRFINTNIGICKFHSIFISALFVCDYHKIPQYPSPRMFLCKSWLFPLYEYHS